MTITFFIENFNIFSSKIVKRRSGWEGFSERPWGHKGMGFSKFRQKYQGESYKRVFLQQYEECAINAFIHINRKKWFLPGSKGGKKPVSNCLEAL